MNSLHHHHVLTFTRTFKRHISTNLSVQIFNSPRSAQQVQSFTASQAEKVVNFPPLNGLPEVIVTGRANSGKSSLFNAVLGRKDLIKTSSKAGRTRKLDFFRVGSPGKIILVDSPGYGDRGRPEWGTLFDSYVQKRKELRRIYITFNAKHTINDKDQAMLAHLSNTLFKALSSKWALSLESGTPRLPRITQVQPVITKADLLPQNASEAQIIIGRLKGDIHDAVKRSLDDAETGHIGISSTELANLMCLSPIISSLRLNPPFGIEDVRKSIVDACNTPD